MFMEFNQTRKVEVTDGEKKGNMNQSGGENVGKGE